jgi:predicted DCC family thiol-disulfide oxidoreductase YuxK
MKKMQPIIFFDGICNLCNGFVQFIIKRDPAARFRFASLQSEVGLKAMKESGLPASSLSTVVYLKDSHYYFKSSAALHVLKDLGGGWKLFYGLILIPKLLRDGVYDILARNRYRIFGKREECMVPRADLQSRFLG